MSNEKKEKKNQNDQKTDNATSPEILNATVEQASGNVLGEAIAKSSIKFEQVITYKPELYNFVLENYEKTDELLAEKLDLFSRREKSMIKILFTKFSDFLENNYELKKKLLWVIVEEREFFILAMKQDNRAIDYKNELDYLLTERIGHKMSQVMISDPITREIIEKNKGKYSLK